MQKIVKRPGIGLICVLIIYSLLLLPTIDRQGISWDEQVDIWVARAYTQSTHGFLYGSSLDPSQTRLPAFTVALVYILLNNSSLFLARLVSWAVGGLTLVGVYAYGKRRLDARRALLASTLLATSPFFLSFARVAFTETDIYLACTFTWLIVGVDWFQDRPSFRRGALVGVLMGFCVSAKFTAVAIFPAVWFACWQVRRHSLQFHTPTAPLKNFFASWQLIATWITLIAVVTFLVTPPEHLLNPEILRSLTGRFQHEMKYQPSFMFEAAALHGLSILFKSSLLIGAGMIISLCLATLQVLIPKTRHPDSDPWRKQFPILLFWLYFGCLILLPLAQTFYAIPLMPILAILTADQFILSFDRKRVLAVGVASLAVLALGFDLFLCYPDYNLNGYQWLGKRELAGRPSVGYRSVVQTPSDGVEQAVEWLNAHAKPGDRVRAYLLSWHIAQATASNPSYRLENGFGTPVSSNPDYVIVEINAQIRQSWWIQSPSKDVFQPVYDTTWLESHYIQVFTVRRAFGIVMASVYQKR